MLTPEIRAMPLALPLLVTGIRADHEHPPVTTDDFALLAHRLDRRSYFHARFALVVGTFKWYLRRGSGDRSGRRYLVEEHPQRDLGPLQAHPGMVAGVLRRSRPRDGGPSGASRRARCRPPVACQLPCAPLRSRCGPAARGLVPGGQDPRPLGSDRDRELEVGGERAVLRVDRPVILADADAVAPGGDHRLRREHPPPPRRQTATPRSWSATSWRQARSGRPGTSARRRRPSRRAPRRYRPRGCRRAR